MNDIYYFYYLNGHRLSEAKGDRGKTQRKGERERDRDRDRDREREIKGAKQREQANCWLVFNWFVFLQLVWISI